MEECQKNDSQKNDSLNNLNLDSISNNKNAYGDENDGISNNENTNVQDIEILSNNEDIHSNENDEITNNDNTNVHNIDILSNNEDIHINENDEISNNGDLNSQQKLSIDNSILDEYSNLLIDYLKENNMRTIYILSEIKRYNMSNWINNCFNKNNKINAAKLWIDKISKDLINLSDISVNSPLLCKIVTSNGEYQDIIVILEDIHNVNFYKVEKDFTVNKTAYYKSKKFCFYLSESEREWYIINKPSFINNIKKLILK